MELKHSIGFHRSSLGAMRIVHAQDLARRSAPRSRFKGLLTASAVGDPVEPLQFDREGIFEQASKDLEY